MQQKMYVTGSGRVPLCPSDEVMRREAVPSTIQPIREWAHSHKAQIACDQQRQLDGAIPFSPLQAFYRASCATCGISIGPGQVERGLYFYPVYNLHLFLLDDEKEDEEGHPLPPPHYIPLALFMICASCAFQRKIDPFFEIIRKGDWTDPHLPLSTLTEVAFNAHLNACWQRYLWVFGFFLSVLRDHMPVRLCLTIYFFPPAPVPKKVSPPPPSPLPASPLVACGGIDTIPFFTPPDVLPTQSLPEGAKKQEQEGRAIFAASDRLLSIYRSLTKRNTI